MSNPSDIMREKLKNMSTDEFLASQSAAPTTQPTQSAQPAQESLKSKWKRFNEKPGVRLTRMILGAFGIGNRSSGGGGGGSTSTGSRSARDEFTQRVRQDEPQPRSHEDWIWDQVAHRGYHQLVDGRGDHDCGHEHD